MEQSSIIVEDVIRGILEDFRQKGYSSVQPFSIGLVEKRMLDYALENGIQLGGTEQHVNFITATRVKDPMEFTLPKYHKI